MAVLNGQPAAGVGNVRDPQWHFIWRDLMFQARFDELHGGAIEPGPYDYWSKTRAVITAPSGPPAPSWQANGLGKGFFLDNDNNAADTPSGFTFSMPKNNQYLPFAHTNGFPVFTVALTVQMPARTSTFDGSVVLFKLQHHIVPDDVFFSLGYNDFTGVLEMAFFSDGGFVTKTQTLTTAQKAQLQSQMVPISMTVERDHGWVLWFDGVPVMVGTEVMGRTFSSYTEVQFGMNGAKEQDGPRAHYGCFLVSNRAWNGNVMRLWAQNPHGFMQRPQFFPALIPPPPTVPPVTPPAVPPGHSAAETDIANAALLCLGAKSIDSLNDHSKVAKLLCDRFVEVRDSVLRIMPWNFATKRALLASAVNTPVYGYVTSFPLPSDCLRLLEVEDKFPMGYRVEGRSILANIPAPLRIVYTSRVEDVAQMDVQFKEVLAAALAVDVGEAIAGSDEKVAVCFQTLIDRLRVASAANGQENPPAERIAEFWERSRGYDETRR